MNYYQHHIGDYAEATAHLSFVEDAAYCRLIRKVYATEAPLPADVKIVQRLVGARTKEEREAVETVLQEFFELQADGWHQARCDAEIAEYREGEGQREQRKSNEKERQRRAREYRATLFEQLREFGIVPKWDTHTAQLVALLSRAQEQAGHAPVTRDSTDQSRTSHAPATVTHTHTHTHSPVYLEDPPPSGPPPEPSGPPASTPEPRAPRSADTAQGTRLPGDWQPDAQGWLMACEYLDGPVKARSTLDAFRDYWAAKPGKDGRKSDWQATWRNWIRRENDTRGKTLRGGEVRDQHPARLSVVERIRRDCEAQQARFEALAEDGRAVRPQVGEPDGDGPVGTVVEGDFRTVG